jgi:hypothetical protein
MMFPSTKRLIDQYEARLSAQAEAHAQQLVNLQSQIEDLRRLVFPVNSERFIPLPALEADAIISGHNSTVEITPEQQAQWDAEISERDKVLSGAYADV